MMLEKYRKAIREDPYDEGNRSRFKDWKSMVKGNVYRDTSEATLPPENEKLNPDRVLVSGYICQILAVLRSSL
jgi:hypothetical protein